MKNKELNTIIVKIFIWLNTFVSLFSGLFVLLPMIKASNSFNWAWVISWCGLSILQFIYLGKMKND